MFALSRLSRYPSTQVTAYCTTMYSDRFMFHLLLQTRTKSHLDFFICKCSCKILIIYSVHTFEMATTFYTLALPSSERVLYTFLVYSTVVASVGCPERGKSLVFVQPHSNSINHREIYVSIKIIRNDSTTIV